MRLSFLGGLAAITVSSACASSPPRELVDARTAYREAQAGPASQYTPTQLQTAQKSLVLAEKTYNDEGDTASTRDRAYVARRKAELATVQARIVLSENRLAKMSADERRRQASELDQARTELQGQREALASEQQRRAEAEKRVEQAAAELKRIADVKQEQRGMVITLSGGVLFANGKSALLPGAQAKLNGVAEALTQAAPDSSILVEGHTDSQGSASFNRDLSAKRAEAVRAYLASRGVAADRMRAEGLGFERPVADNKSAEGRANNRRVEIVVQPAASPASANASQPLPAAEEAPSKRVTGAASEEPMVP